LKKPALCCSQLSEGNGTAATALNVPTSAALETAAGRGNKIILAARQRSGLQNYAINKLPD
jgi:hypothetical protein